MARTKTVAKTKTTPRKRATRRPGATASAGAPTGAQRTRRAIGYLSALSICLFTSLALASYSPTDPAFSRRSSVEEIANWCGRWGALLADLMYQGLGYGSWGVLFLGIWLGLRFARRGDASWLKLVFGVLGTWWTSTLLALVAWPDLGGDFREGGVLGHVSARWMLEYVGTAGSYVVVCVLLLVSGTIFFGINWEGLAGRGVDVAAGQTPRVWSGVSGMLARAWSGAGERLRSARSALAERREARREAIEAARAEAEAAWMDEESEELHSPSEVSTPSAGPSEDLAPPAPSTPPRPRAREPRAEPSPVVAIPIHRPEPVVAVGGGVGGIQFGPPTPVPVGPEEGEDRTQVARRELVEVEYEPTGVDESVAATPATPALPSRLGRATPITPVHGGYDVPLAGSAPRGSSSTPAPYLDEPEMGDGSVYGEPAGRASGFDVVEPLFLRPSLAEEREEEPSVVESSVVESSVVESSVVESSVAEAPSVPREPVLHPLLADDPDSEELTHREIELDEPIRPASAVLAKGPRIQPGNLVSGGSDAEIIVRPSVPDIIWELPSTGLLDQHDKSVGQLDEQLLKDMAAALVQKLADFNVRGEVTAIRPGPVITIFEYLPAPGIKVSKIAGLTDDIAMAMRALRVRIVAPIPGKGVVGIEIPNDKRQTVWFRDLLASKEFRTSRRQLAMAVGKTPEGRPFVTDLAKMPHLLVGGTTGSGKSVGVNSMLMSMLYTCSPEVLRLILIDPKMLEFELYNDIPHLLHPVVTEPKLASAALKWACTEMDERYRLLARWSVRNIVSYNEKVERELKDWTPKKARRYAGRRWPKDQAPPTPAKLPYIVVVIDELADLMMVASKEVEESIVRLAQKARACGIHLIVATQRPSVDVITGLIKANMPSRIAFQVRSRTDGRTILDQNGAESLLGKGDMLLLPPGVSALQRLHGAFVSDEECARVCEFWRDQGEPVYEAEIRVEEETGVGEVDEDDYDDCYDLAVQIVTEAGKASTSMIQRRLKIGYNRAARIMDMMEREGVVGAADGARPRKVLVPPMEH